MERTTTRTLRDPRCLDPHHPASSRGDGAPTEPRDRPKDDRSETDPTLDRTRQPERGEHEPATTSTLSVRRSRSIGSV
jgi:hypothetical protein